MAYIGINIDIADGQGESESPDAGQHLAPPTIQLLDSRVDQVKIGTGVQKPG